MRPSVLLFAFLATGCAGTQSHLRLLENAGALRVDPGPTPGIYIVTIKNTKDFNFDPDNLDTRNGAALQALETQCPRAHVVGETVINTGQFLMGNPARTYAIKVACV